CSRDSPWMNRFMGHLAQNGCTDFNFARAGLEVFSHSLGQERSLGGDSQSFSFNPAGHTMRIAKNELTWARLIERLKLAVLRMHAKTD
ncbi:hypothetical protein ACSFBI_31710, partial [Variovorax sp. RB3P1]|uniref:hypothetical protein n=1 Tax=Variovorax sp. RB3P1 TaxID=3443732 RepID=UPI003F463852